MNDQMQQALDNALLAREVKQIAENGYKTGVFAGWFIKGALASDAVTMKDALALYAWYVEAIPADAHCHCESDHEPTEGTGG